MLEENEYGQSSRELGITSDLLIEILDMLDKLEHTFPEVSDDLLPLNLYFETLLDAMLKKLN